MNPVEILNLALTALNGVLALIAKIKAQSGLTDDQILAEAQKQTLANDTTYQQLVLALKGTIPPPPTSGPTA